MRVSGKTNRLRFLNGWRAVFDNSYSCPFHQHTCIEIVYHPRGRGWTDMADGNKLYFEPGSVVVYPPGASHNQILTCPGEDVVVQIEAEPMPSEFVMSAISVKMTGQIISDIGVLASPPAARSSLQRQAFDHRAAAVLFELLEACHRAELCQAGDGNSYAERASRYIREQYREIQKLPDVACAVGIGYDHLRHVFRKRYGISLQDWLNTTRMERARELLRHSNLPLKAIASLCGFHSDRYFCGVFRVHNNMTPGEYRKLRSQFNLKSQFQNSA